MANDLVTRLLLETQQFDGNLTRSSQQVRNFQDGIGRADKGFESFTKSLTGVGISLKSIGWMAAISAVGQFAKMGIEATQQSDLFAGALDATKTTLNSLAGALMSADFSTFNDGLIEGWRRAYNLAEAIDSLADRMNASKIYSSEAQYDFNEAVTEARDITNSLADRQAAVNRAKEIANGLNEDNLKTQQKIRDIIEKTWIAETGQNLTADHIREIAKAGEEYDGIYAKIKEIDSETMKIANRAQFSFFGTTGETYKEIEKVREALKVYSEEQMIIAKNWYKFNDDQRKSLTENLVAEKQLHQQRQTMGKTVGKLNISVNKQVSGTGGKSGSISPPRESIETMSQLNAAIDAARTKWTGASDALQKYNAFLEYQKLLQTRDRVTPKEIEAPGLPVASGGIIPAELQSRILADMKARRDANLEEARSNYKLAESYGITASQLGMLASNVGSISDNPGIRALAASLAVLAAVQGVVEASSWAEKLIAIVSLTAATVSMFSSLSGKKFAGGGIVGDRNIVRVNQGEMILNSRQQQRLFDQISFGGRENSQANIRFVISGQELIGVQENFNHKFRNNRNYGYNT